MTAKELKSVFQHPVNLIILLVLLSTTAYFKNSIWKDEVTLWDDVIEKSQKKGRAHYNFGVDYNQCQLDDAIREYLTALELNPDIPEIHYNMGNTYQINGLKDKDKAEKEFEIALKLKHDFTEAKGSLK